MARFVRFAIAVVASTLAILILTFGTYYLHLWVGGHLSVRDFILRSLVLFPIVVGLVAGLWPSPHLNRAPFAAGAAGAAIGLAYGYLVPRVMFSYGMGYWVGFGRIDTLVDLAALVCAVVAGTCAMLLSITSRCRAVIVATVLLILIAVLVPGPTLDLVVHNQELTVVVLTPRGDAPLSGNPDVLADVYSTPVDVGTVTSRVLALLRDHGITGQYRVSHMYREGHGREVLAVIVLNQPVVSTVRLQEPRGCDVIYLQQPEKWEQIPSQVRTVHRFLTLRPPVSGGAMAGLMIDGIGKGTGFEVWKTAN
jgi:hypothetical protein